MRKALVLLLGALAMGCNVKIEETEVDPQGEDIGETFPDGVIPWLPEDVSGRPNADERYFILLDNTGGSSEASTPGVDIDYAAIISSDGSVCFADTVGSATYIGGGANNEYADEFNAIGSDDCPDSGPWPQCFVSLGEEGSLSLGFLDCPGGILPGDIIEVGEIMGGWAGEESCVLSLCCEDNCMTCLALGEGEGIFAAEIYETDLAECDN